MNAQTTTSNERTLAGLAHLSVILGFLTNGVGGAIAAVFIWATQKDKSDFVAFHALQSAVYQLVGMVVTLLVWCCWIVFYIATFIPVIPQMEQTNTPPPLFWIGIGSMIIPLGFMGLWVLYGVWGALRTFSGVNFRYIVIANWVERYLAQEKATA